MGGRTGGRSGCEGGRKMERSRRKGGGGVVERMEVVVVVP